MLEFIRDRAQTWVAWIIVGFISLTFALWGVSNYLGGGGDVPIAEVNGSPISQAQLQSDYLRQRQRLESMLGENFRPEMFSEERMKQQILQELIERELVVNAAARAGFRIGDSFLSQTIRGISAFQQEGKFSDVAYQQALRMQGMNPGLFEHQLRRDLIAQQFINGIVETDFTTPREQRDYLRLQNQQRRFGYMVVPVSNFEEKASVTEQQIQDYYDANIQRYMVPEQVKIAYLDLKVDDIAVGIDVSEEEMQSRYEAQQVNYRSQEQRRASHILLLAPDKGDEARIKKAESKLRELKVRVEQGESFAELAKEFSEDPGSASNGGDLGFFAHGVMDNAFDETVFKMEKGAVSEPVETEYGLHLIQLVDIQAPRPQLFEEVKEEIRAEIRREQAEQQFFDKAEILANLTYEHPDTLEEAARELNLRIKESAAFPRQGGSEPITTSQKVIAAAFSEDVLNGGNNSETIEVSTDQLVVLRIREHMPEAVRPFAEVSGTIEGVLKHQQANALAAEKADDLIKQVEEGGEPQQLALQEGIEWHQPQLLGRKAPETDAAVVKKAFAMPRPAAGGTSSARATTGSGDHAVIVLSEVSERGTDEQLSAPDMASLSRSNGEAAYVSTMSSLRARGDIVIR